MKKIAVLSVLIFNTLLLFAQGKMDAHSNRPQTPKPPFTYNTDSVEYDNADHTVHLGATFSYPKGGGPFLTILMITGSGLQDRDETILGHKPFAVMADYLTKKGFAVLRVDDRMKGKSTGDVKNATSPDFAEDALTSIHFLLQRKEVDKNKIGVIGHSEGGFIAPLIYSKWPHLAFIISLAGTGVKGEEISLYQTQMAKALFDSVSYEAIYDLNKMTLRTISKNAAQPDSVILSTIKKEYAEWKSKQPDSVLKKLHADMTSPEIYAMQVKPQLMPWTKYFLSTDPGPYWQKVQCPVLALNGEKDIQVNAAQNISAIKTNLERGGNAKLSTIIFPGLNHLFQHCTKCTVQEYGELEETFAPEVLQAMGDWLENINR